MLVQQFKRSKKKFKTAQAAWRDIASRTKLTANKVTSKPHTPGFWVFSIMPKKRITKKKATKKRAIRRSNPVIKDHIVIAELRPDREQEARKKGLSVVKRIYFDGAAWTTGANNAAHYRNRTQAVKIARLVVESKVHNNRLRQIAVIEAPRLRGK